MNAAFKVINMVFNARMAGWSPSTEKSVELAKSVELENVVEFAKSMFDSII